MAELVKNVAVSRLEEYEHVVYLGPQLYLGKRSIEQQATQLELKREYDIINLLNKLLNKADFALIETAEPPPAAVSP